MKEIRTIIHNYLIGKASAEETEFIKQLISGHGDSELKNEMLTEWSRTEDDPDIDLQPLLYKIHYELNLRSQRKSAVRRSLIIITQCAAAVMIPLLIFTTIYAIRLRSDLIQLQNTWTTLVSPANSRVEFLLPDGTQGWLNKSSSLMYPAHFGKERRVKLEGEAYFDVTRNEKHPFVIEVPDMNIRVLGTKFNVMAYKEFPYTEIVLETGKVRLEGISNNPPIEMVPNTKVTYNKSLNTFSKNTLDAHNYISWTEGKLIFRNAGLDEIAHRLSIWYDVDVEIADKELKDFTYHATFEDESIEEVLNLMKHSSLIKYKIIERKKNKDNTFSRKKIILF
jgi:transmembrane sensor